MPKIASKPTGRAMKYPLCYVEFCIHDLKKIVRGIPCRGPLLAVDAKKLLGWQTEKEHEEQGKGKFPDTLPIPIFEDVEGNRVVCWNNAHNRPFEREWALARAQDLLTGCWRFNMENLIISMYGTVISAQHRLISLVFADQLWRGPQKLHWQSLSKQPPSMECIIAYGCEETPEVLQTLDNVRPRSEADVIYTSNIFGDLNHYQRKECSRMHAAAIDLLWKRTGAGKNSDAFNRYKTNSTALDFAERHKRLVECVRHIFKCNVDRRISMLQLSPGQCAAMQYMMAAQGTDIDVYANGTRSEVDIDFSAWDDAEQFWTMIGNKDETLAPLYIGLKLLKESDGQSGIKARGIEKITLIAAAWSIWKNNGKSRLIEDDLLTREGGYLHPKLVYSVDQTTLLESEGFGGIDEGYKSKEPTKQTKADIEKRKEEVRNGKGVQVENEEESSNDSPLVGGRISPAAQAEADRRRKILEKNGQRA